MWLSLLQKKEQTMTLIAAKVGQNVAVIATKKEQNLTLIVAK